jgi:aryl-alcohol dehydrogenase-like predicted oxidoreductase
MKDLQATTAGTKNFAARYGKFAYQELGRTGLFVSEAGFGSYRVSINIEPHYEALHKALSSGINLIDTSSNYADGGSQQLIGKVLADLIEAGTLQRDEIVIVSKAGYLQGENLTVSAEKKRSNAAFSDSVVFNEDLEHCIHPDFLRHQITDSLERLQLTTIDCFLLHNPEYYFLWAQQQGLSQAAAQAEFLRRIELAFRYLETEVQAGRIGCYGISSNTFSMAADSYDLTPLDQIWTIAESIDGENHFRIIEFPLNVFETNGATEINQKNGQTLLEFAQQQGLAVLINRPLNTVCDDKIRRLADLTGPDFNNVEFLVSQIKAMIDMENAFRLTFITQLTDEELSQPDLFKGLACGEIIQKKWYTFDSYWHWQHVRASYFNPLIQHSINLLTSGTTLTLPMKHWIEEYINLLNPLFTNVTNYYRGREMKRIQLDKAMIACCDEDWALDCSLSQLAIHVLRSTAGVSTILVGMRDESYVSDVLAELARSVTKLPRKASWQCLAHKAAEATIDELSLLPIE